MKKTTIIFIISALFAISCNQTRRQAETANYETVCEKTEGNNIIDEIVCENGKAKYLCTRKLYLFSLIDVLCEARAIRDIRFVPLPTFVRFPTFYNADNVYFSDWEQQTNQKFFELNAEYRRQLLERNGISETDTLFVYDYVANALLAFPVNELDVFAHLIWHYDRDTPPHPIWNYQIGLGIDSDRLSDFHWNPLVYIGQSHPFVRGGLVPIVWERISPDDFPINKTQLGLDSLNVAFRHWLYHPLIVNSKPGYAFVFEWHHYRYYMQVWGVYVERWNNEFVRVGAHLLVFNTKNNELIVERSFREEEFIGLTSMIIKGYEEERDISSQWTGYLFRSKPPVVFQFESGWLCTYFIFLDPAMEDIEVVCEVIGC